MQAVADSRLWLLRAEGTVDILSKHVQAEHVINFYVLTEEYDEDFMVVL